MRRENRIGQKAEVGSRRPKRRVREDSRCRKKRGERREWEGREKRKLETVVSE